MPVIRRLVLLFALFLAGSAMAEHLRLAGDSWPPFTDQRLANNGLAVDLVSTALQRAGYTTEYAEAPWARALYGLQQGDYDLLVAAWYSDERTRYGLFSEPYLINRIRFLQHQRTHIRFDSLADLRPYNIAVVRGYSYSSDFDQDASLQKVPVLEFAMGARMLAAGRVQLAVEDELVAQHYLNRELSEVKSGLEFLPKPLSENGLHILVRRSHPLHQQIVQDFNRAIAAMRADGSYARIYRRHGLQLQE
ncbi:amino acid ABC transporter substrate-binding protein [Pseudomonas alcaligenes]|uniref:Amino acid ABC transporter substrate-binding protein n=1 Tax=Aquipseudomonas alcaligenes TaxID=43263 RepID=A0ABR7RUU7_AQUAC|nr:transporter substrate-binding domain-containing protein [Pseudomonas alcaligenes]MBC9248966.1 amino acid ABC transporter substrate-binding protein [Pseudomonas alcaligenes]